MPENSPDKLLERLGRGEPIPAIVLLGDDHYLRDLCRAKIIEAAAVPAEARDWAVLRMSARESGWDEILARAQMLPMFAPRQVVLVDDAGTVERLGEKAREQVIAALEKYFAEPSPLTTLVLEAPSLDGRQRFSKLLYDKAVCVELTIGSESAASLAMQMAKDLRAALDRDAAALLADIMNGQPARIRMELEKLATYVHGRNRITMGDVENLVVAARKNTVWQLADLLVSRKRNEALSFVDNLLRQGEPIPQLVGALAWTYRKLIEARDLPPRTSGYQAARTLGMNPTAAETAIRQAHRIPKADLLDGLAALAEADSESKSSNPDPAAMMDFLIARLASPAVSAAARST